MKTTNCEPKNHPTTPYEMAKAQPPALPGDDTPTDSANARGIAVADRVQAEDITICESVQRGLHSRAYDTGRLSVRREAGEHQFHRLLSRDLNRAAI